MRGAWLVDKGSDLKRTGGHLAFGYTWTRSALAGCKGQNKGMGGREEGGELAGEGRGLKPTPFLLFRPDLDQPPCPTLYICIPCQSSIFNALKYLKFVRTK